jgi:hypothetical protein
MVIGFIVAPKRNAIASGLVMVLLAGIKLQTDTLSI